MKRILLIALLALPSLSYGAEPDAWGDPDAVVYAKGSDDALRAAWKTVKDFFAEDPGEEGDGGDPTREHKEWRLPEPLQPCARAVVVGLISFAGVQWFGMHFGEGPIIK